MIINPYIFGSGFDPDAQAFITAAAITDSTQQNAINTLVIALKGYSIWTKMKAIYPIVGGVASSHKYNLKDPRDLDAAFRLTFTVGWTHSANGMTPSVAYANTFLTHHPFVFSFSQVSFYMLYLPHLLFSFAPLFLKQLNLEHSFYWSYIVH